MSRGSVLKYKSFKDFKNVLVFYCNVEPHLHHNRFMALFQDHPRDLVPEENFRTRVQGKINRGRHTDHPAGRHSIRTNQCPPPPSPNFLQAGCPSCRSTTNTNSVKALKATSAFG